MKSKILGFLFMIVMIASMLMGVVMGVPFFYEVKNGIFTIWDPCYSTMETGAITIEKVEAYPRRVATIPLIYQGQGSAECPAIYKNVLPSFGPGVYRVISAQIDGVEFVIPDEYAFFSYYPITFYFPLVNK